MVDLFFARSFLPIKEAEEKEEIRPGCIYIAPAYYHLLVEKDETFSLDASEKINFSRPSIDACMETAAEAFRERAVGILLSGANADGVAGLQHIKQRGGHTVAQRPDTAVVDYMPRQAIERGVAESALTPEEIVALINLG